MFGELRRGNGSSNQGVPLSLALDTLIRYRDGGCVAAPPPMDEQLLHIMDFAVGGADMTEYLPSSRRGWYARRHSQGIHQPAIARTLSPAGELFAHSALFWRRNPRRQLRRNRHAPTRARRRRGSRTHCTHPRRIPRKQDFLPRKPWSAHVNRVSPVGGFLDRSNPVREPAPVLPSPSGQVTGLLIGYSVRCRIDGLQIWRPVRR